MYDHDDDDDDDDDDVNIPCVTGAPMDLFSGSPRSPMPRRRGESVAGSRRCQGLGPCPTNGNWKKNFKTKRLCVIFIVKLIDNNSNGSSQIVKKWF